MGYPLENEKVKYWIDLSDHDLETASAMLETKRFLYVGFMYHQTVEKILKGYYSLKFEKFPPYTRDLFRLLNETELLREITTEQKNFLELLQPMNVQARYPAYKEKVLKSLNEEKSKNIIFETTEFVKWVKKKLSK